MLCSIYHVRKIKILSVVSCDKIGINFLNKVSPSNKKFLFCFITVNLSSHNLSTALKSENIPDNRFRFSVNFNNVCNLNDWVLVWCWEFAFFCRAFNIEWHNSERRNIWILFERYWLNVGGGYNIKFELTSGHLLCFSSEKIFASLNLNPLHSYNVTIDHEPKSKRHIRLIGCCFKIVEVTLKRIWFRGLSLHWKLNHLLFKKSSKLIHIFRKCHINFEELRCSFTVEHYRSLLTLFNVGNNFASPTSITLVLIDLTVKLVT